MCDYFNEKKICIIYCSFESIGVTVYYFSSETNTIFYELCTGHKKISEIIKKEFKTVNENLLLSSDVTTIEEKSIYSKELRKLEQEYLNKKIIIDLQRYNIKLFGLTETIDEIQSKIKELNKKHESPIVKLTLTEQQVRFDDFFLPIQEVE